jgi:chromosome segregation ATPase
MSTELEEKHVECVNLHQDIDTNQDEISSLCQKINHSEQELRIHKQEKNLADEKVQGLNYDLATVKARLDQQKNDSDVLKEKAMQVNDLQLKLASKTLQLRTVEENQSKAELCISGLTQMTIEQKQAISRLEKEVNTRDKAIDKLTAEYEKVKAKVRKYRSLREQYESQIHGQGIIGDNSGSSIGERDNMYNARDEENDDKPHSNSSLQKNTIIVSENNPKKEPAKDKELKYLVEEVQLHQKEIALLKGELRVCKSVFMKTGASRAMEKVEKVYNDQMTKVDHAHGKIVGIMRRRLEELADCIQKILGSHNGIISGLNMSNLSTGDVSALSDILNESRRLSRSFFTAQR